MIGFNGTYLKAATHHGMRITAACLGGQWVIGSKNWLLNATQQAILAAFGAEEGMVVISKTNDYLNAIAATDTQRAQQLADFIQEDPLLVCSLVETSKTRWLTIRNDAIYGYANGLVLDVELKDIDIVKTCVQKIDGNNWIILSKFSGSSATNPAFGKDFNDMGVTYTANPNPWDAMAVTELELTINRTDAAKTWWGSFINSTWSRNFRTKYIEIISKSGERVLYLVPFTREGKAYMLNLDTFELLTNYISNDSFTIQLTPKTTS